MRVVLQAKTLADLRRLVDETNRRVQVEMLWRQRQAEKEKKS